MMNCRGFYAARIAAAVRPLTNGRHHQALPARLPPSLLANSLSFLARRTQSHVKKTMGSIRWDTLPVNVLLT